MLEWLTSKIAMIIAAMVILTSVFGYFIVQTRFIEESEMQNVADEIATQVNGLSSINGEAVLTMGFTDSMDSIKLKNEIGGEGYTIVITSNMVIVKQPGKSPATAHFIENVHVWNPEESVSITDPPDAPSKLEFSSGTDFNIVNKKMVDDNLYPTFIYTI